MAGNIRIFVGYPLALEPFCVLLSSARCYRLKPDADLAVLPFDDDLQDALHDRFGTGDWPENQGVLLSTTDQAFAAECSQRAPLAYLQCDDGAEGVFQSAAVWKAGQITIGPVSLDMSGPGARRPTPLRPINVALRALGVVAGSAVDEAAAFGLATYASNADICARGWPCR